MSQLSRRITPFNLFMLSMNGIIGSGWLFAPLYAAKAAGSAAIFSWVIGGLAAMLIAFTFAELSAMLPVAGGTARIPQLSHGAFASYMLSWIGWITALMMAPIEVQAVLQYAAIFFPSLMNIVDGIPTLSLIGYAWAAILMILMCVINVMSYHGLARFNSILFFFKSSVMVLTIFAIFNVRFIPGNFSDMTTTLSTGAGWQAILSAVATGGIVLAFNGFKTGVEMAGEAKNLAVALPLSTAGSVFACLLLYLGLQICFIGALDPAILKNGFANLNFTGDLGPFVGLAGALGLVILLKLLYVNSVVSPLGAGLIYVTSTARILYAISKLGYVPKWLSNLNQHQLPVAAIIVNFLFGMLSFLPLPGWQAMVNFLVSTMVITYAMGPISLMALRLSLPDQHRPFKLPYANTLCFLAFYSCNLFSYWTGWVTISKLAIVLIAGLLLFAIAYFRGTVKLTKDDFQAAYWMVPYLLGLILISYCGSFGGGQNLLPFGWDFAVIATFSAVILYFAVRRRSLVSRAEIRSLIPVEQTAMPEGA
jgi:amino acid transporter